MFDLKPIGIKAINGALKSGSFGNIKWTIRIEREITTYLGIK